jgi:carbamoyl-phosphate synthase large subunit
MESMGHYYVIDINPRFGGGYQMSEAAGVPMAKYLIENVNGKPAMADKQYPHYKADMTYLKYDTIHVKG